MLRSSGMWERDRGQRNNGEDKKEERRRKRESNSRGEAGYRVQIMSSESGFSLDPSLWIPFCSNLGSSSFWIPELHKVVTIFQEFQQ